MARDDIEDGITAVRALMPRLRINEETCELGIAGIGQYRKKSIENIVGPNNEKLYSNTPEDNWATHPADGLRTLAMGLVSAAYDSEIPDDLAPKIAMV
jgi:phage terminase large subunit